MTDLTLICETCRRPVPGGTLDACARPRETAADGYLDAVRRLFRANPPEDPALRARVTGMLQADCPSAGTSPAEGEASP